MSGRGKGGKGLGKGGAKRHRKILSQNDLLLSLFRTHFLPNKLFSPIMLKHFFRLVTQNSN